MALTLNDFSCRLNQLEQGQTLYVNSKGKIKTQGKIGTLFTFRSTFQNTTRLFLNAYEQTYGVHSKYVAEELMLPYMKGKALNAAIVHDINEMGEQTKALNTTIINDFTKTTSEGFEKTFGDVFNGIKGYAENDVVAQKIRQLVGKAIGNTIEINKDKILCPTIQNCTEEELTFLRDNPLKVVLNKTLLTSPLLNEIKKTVDLYQPFFGSVDKVKDKKTELLLKKLNILEVFYEFNAISTIPEPSINKAIQLLFRRVEQNPTLCNDETGVITRKSIIAALLELNPAVGTIEDPKFDLQVKDKSGFNDCICNLMTDIYALNLDEVPINSIFRDPESKKINSHKLCSAKQFSSPKSFLEQIKKSVVNLTIKDVPLIQEEITIDAAFEGIEDAKKQAYDDLKLRGQSDEQLNNAVQLSPSTVTLTNSERNDSLCVEVGVSDSMGGQYSLDKLLPLINSSGLTNAQKKIIFGSLSKEGIRPLMLLNSYYRDPIYKIEAFSHFNTSISVTRSMFDDAKIVRIEIARDEELSACYGCASIVYTVDAAGQVSISDLVLGETLTSNSVIDLLNEKKAFLTAQFEDYLRKLANELNLMLTTEKIGVIRMQLFNKIKALNSTNSSNVTPQKRIDFTTETWSSFLQKYRNEAIELLNESR